MPSIFLLLVLTASWDLDREPAAAGIGATRGEEIRPARESVYKLSLAADLAITGAASLAIVIPYAFSSRLITPRCPCDPNEVNGIDRRAIGNASGAADTASTITTGAAILAPVLLDYWKLGPTKPFLEDGIVFAETLAVNEALVTLTKFAIHRPIPLVYSGRPDLIRDTASYLSFYSGHTSLTFAALSAASMTLQLRYKIWWPWLVTLAIGSSVAVERVLAGRHFPTDVVIGAVMGTASGVLVPWFHTRNDLESKGLILVPRADGVQLAFIKRY